MTIGRNNPCPCGSGKKVKKCHEIFVGWHEEAAEMYADHLAFFERQPGYMAPMSEDERREWRRTGCPTGDCLYGTDEPQACAAVCGV